MSDELRLPDDLAACEARLAAMAPAASGIDRDQLLYRAGWAAGAETARLAVATPPPLKGGLRRVQPSGARGGIFTLRTTALCSAASAALAASLAVAMTLQWKPTVLQGPLVADDAHSEQRPAAAVVADANAASPDRVRAPAHRATAATDVERFLAGFARGDGSRHASPVLALHRPWLPVQASDPQAAADSAAYAPAAAAKTARQMLDEMLPAAEKPAPFVPSRLWPFSDLNLGGAI